MWKRGCPADGPHRRALPQVRVFTFSVGQHNYDVTPLQWMACANKGEQGWHPDSTGGCGVLGSPLTSGLAPGLRYVPLPGGRWLQPWRAGQPECRTGRQLPFSFFSKVTTSKSPPSAPSASTRRYGRVLAGRVPAGRQCHPPGVSWLGSPLQRAHREAASVATSWGAAPSPQPGLALLK